MSFNNANRKHLREAEKAAELASANRIAYVRHIMSDTFGRGWMYDLLSRCNIFHTPFVKGLPDATAFQCGAQNIGLQLLGDVATHCPREYSLMMTEASTKEATNARRTTESANDADRATGPGPAGHTPEPVFDIDSDGFVCYGPDASASTDAEAGSET